MLSWQKNDLISLFSTKCRFHDGLRNSEGKVDQGPVARKVDNFIHRIVTFQTF